jgi:molybdopterin molybdotransferase
MTDEAYQVASLLSVDEAIAIIDAVPVRPRVVEAGLSDAVGQYLGRAISADRDYPPFDKSLMDGFAVRCSDTAGGQAELKIVGEVLAGMEAGGTLEAGKAMGIMTGAPLPAGADGVVPIEDAGVRGDQVVIRVAAVAGRFVTRRGSDCSRGKAVLSAGTRMGAAQVAVAASVGAERVSVFARPRVGVLTTGDEVVVRGPVLGHQIRDGNGPMLRALLKRLGYPTSGARHVTDDAAAVTEAIEAALVGNEVLLVAGGMSVGQRDFVPGALEKLGFDLRIRKLRIKPGKPFVFAVGKRGGEDRFVFGLPGNPVSAFVCTVRLVERLLRRMSGGVPDDGVVCMPLAEGLGANGPREFYQPAEITMEGWAKPLQWKGSADVFTLARAGGLIVRSENAPVVDAGKIVRVMILQ